MESFAVGDIVLFKFPFSNQRGYKKRPCIVVSEVVDSDILLCQITSKKPSHEYYIIVESEKNKLNVVSYAKINKLFSVDTSHIDHKIDLLTKENKEKLFKKLNEFFTLRHKG